MKDTLRNKVLRYGAIALGAVMMTGCLAACKNNDDPPVDGEGNKRRYDMETTPVTFSSGELDGVFNPFFSTSAYDGEIAGMTMISMLSADAYGGIAYGREEPVMTLDYSQTLYDIHGAVTQTGSKDGSTVYEFLIKNGVKDSQGNPITIKDVLFNLYVYLDPVYNGSSTMYSTKIEGLNKYRTGQDDDGAAGAFEQTVTSQAIAERLLFINYAYSMAGTDPSKYPNPDSYSEADKEKYEGYITYLYSLFETMLTQDWNGFSSSMESATESYILVDPAEYRTNKINPRTYEITRVWEYFCIMEGMAQFVTVNDKEKTNEETPRYYAMIDEGIINEMAKITSTGDARTEAEKAIVFDAMRQEYTVANGKNQYAKIEELVMYFSISSEFLSYLRDIKRSELLKDAENISSISGITTRKTTQFNGKTYASEHDVLTIKINGVDPKAIWNFAFTVAPMAYYASPAEINAFNADAGHFGIEKGSTTYRDTYLKDVDRMGLPIGGGAYMASNENGRPAQSRTEFRSKNVVYFERNPYFYTLGIDSETATQEDYSASAETANTAIHNAKIKYIRYQVVSSSAVMDTMIAREIDYSSDISAKQMNINTLNGYADYLSYARQPNNGYGYIGVNPKYVPDIEVRRLIMYAMDRQTITENYYTDGLGEIIERPMTTNSWAYPEGATAYYTQDWFVEHFSKDLGLNLQKNVDTVAFITNALTLLGYTKSGGVLEKTLRGESGTKKSRLEYTFTIAGDTKDHPAYAVFAQAAEDLNAAGMKITVKMDATALSKLANGSLSVWAAAWGSTIDPDMYQVYHMYSQATSVNNWGYSEILTDSTGVYKTEKGIIEKLSEKIDSARETLSQPTRTLIYKAALDDVMELAVELPTYQRVNLLVYNSSKIDPKSLTPTNELTAYHGLINKIWELELR